MKCRRVIKNLPAYLDRELSEPESAELERHLAVCVYCSTELAALRATSGMLDAWENVSPRRFCVGSVVSQIRAAELGALEGRGTWLRALGGRWMAGVLRAAAAVAFVVGAGLFSVNGPVREAAEGSLRAELGEAHPAREMILLDEDLRRSFIRPSEYGLVVGAMGNRARILRAASSDPAVRKARGSLPLVEDGSGGGISHVYYPEEGMPVESFIPVDSW